MNLKALALSAIMTGAACTPKAYLPANVGNTSSGAEISPTNINRKNIDEILDARHFGFDNLGFNPESPHYSTYRPGDVITPYRTLNILVINNPDNLSEDIGERLTTERFREKIYPYVQGSGYFSEVSFGSNDIAKRRLQDIEAVYREQGYDTFLLNTDDFDEHDDEQGASITPKFMKLGIVDQVQNVYSLSCDYTLEARNFPSELEDSLCKVLELQGTLAYFKERKGENSVEYKRALKSLEDFRNETEMINGIYESKDAEGFNTAKLALQRPETKWFTLFSEFYDSKSSVKRVLDAVEGCPPYQSDCMLHIRDNWAGLSYQRRLELSETAKELRRQEDSPSKEGLPLPTFSTEKHWRLDSSGNWRVVKPRRRRRRRRN